MNTPNKVQKAGPWSKEEKKFITENCDKMSHLDIAAKLRRNPETTLSYIVRLKGNKTNIPLPDKFNTQAEYDIKASPIWRVLQKEFDNEELDFFLFYWDKIISQFGNDVLSTEQLQVIDYIKLEILISRCLKQQNSARLEVKKLEEEMAALSSLPSGDAESNLKIQEKSHELLAYRGIVETSAREYVNLLQRKDSILKELKGTRAERIKQIESSKQTLIGWIQELLRNKEARTELGTYMEKMRIAIDLEKVRLMQPHKFADNILDYPRLTAETLENIKEDK